MGPIHCQHPKNIEIGKAFQCFGSGFFSYICYRFTQYMISISNRISAPVDSFCLSTGTLRDVSYNARWFWTTIRYGPMTTAYLYWTTGNGF